MGKKGRPKPKLKQSGKKRSKGKQTASRRFAKARGLSNGVEDNYFVNRSEYEPVRKTDSDDEEKEKEEGEKMVEVEEDIMDDDQDLDILQQPHVNLKFLTGFDTEEKKQSKKKRKASIMDNIEESYEKHPRLAGEGWHDEGHMLLPLKAKSGVIPQPTLLPKNDASNLSTTDETNITLTDDNAGSNAKVEENVAMATLSAVDLLRFRQEKINTKKLLITNLVSEILKDPYANVEKLHEMNKLCEEKDSDISITIRKLAIVSQLEVFKDIIPGYHIRLLSEAEKVAKVSKDIKRIRKFEQGLLESYQKFLQILEKVIRERKMYNQPRKFTQNTSQKDLPMIALECLCDLLTSVSHFNFRTNIMAVLVPQINDKSANGKVSALCCQTIQTVFKTDSVGEISLEIVQLISKFVKSQSFKVKPCVLETFLSLQLHDADLQKKNNEKTKEKPKHKNKLDKEKKKKMSKNDRKRVKEMKKLEHELQEAEAVEGKQKSQKMQTEIIKLVFSIYFRVLKISGVHSLLAPVLAGLSKYIHLINVDFFADLMVVLQNLVNSEEILSRDKLHCILTAFKILSGQGEALNIDPQVFYSHLYSTLLNIRPESTSNDVTVALECLDVMLSKRRKQVSIQRLLAYIKRLCTVSLQQLPSTSLALLSCARSFLQMHTKAGIILDNDFSGSGVFRPEIHDPEYANADSTALWEVVVFQNHYEPTIRCFARNISVGNPAQGPSSLPIHLARKTPLGLFEEYNGDKQLLSFLNSSISTKPQQKPKTTRLKHNLDSIGGQWLQEDIKKCNAWMDSQEIRTFEKCVFN